MTSSDLMNLMRGKTFGELKSLPLPSHFTRTWAPNIRTEQRTEYGGTTVVNTQTKNVLAVNDIDFPDDSLSEEMIEHIVGD